MNSNFPTVLDRAIETLGCIGIVVAFIVVPWTAYVSSVGGF